MRSVNDWVGNILAFGVTIAVNSMATSIPLGGRTPREISDAYPSLFTPSGLTFSIWALIYLGLTLFVIYQALPAQRQSQPLADLGSYFKIGCGANVLWIFAWHYEWLVPSLLLMLVLLATLMLIYRDLQIVNADASAGQRWFVQFPFAIIQARVQRRADRPLQGQRPHVHHVAAAARRIDRIGGHASQRVEEARKRRHHARRVAMGMNDEGVGIGLEHVVDRRQVSWAL